MKTAKIDLHLHLDGSLNVHWMYEMSKKRGVIEPETSFEQYYRRQSHKRKNYCGV